MADSKRLLADALTGLMECKPLDQVRVAEIASAAGVSKQTFYHHFSDKYHLMECCFRDMFAAPFKRMGTLAPFDECYIEFLQLCHQRKTFLRNAFTSQDVNSLYRVMHRALRDAFGARVRVHGVLDEGGDGVLPGFLLERLRRLHAPLVRPGHGLRGCRAGRPHPPVHPRWGRKVFRVAGRSGANKGRRCVRMIAVAGRLLDGFAGFGPCFRSEIVLLGGFPCHFSRSLNKPLQSPWSGKSQ